MAQLLREVIDAGTPAVPGGHHADAMIFEFFLPGPRGHHSHLRGNGLVGIRATAGRAGVPVCTRASITVKGVVAAAHCCASSKSKSSPVSAGSWLLRLRESRFASSATRDVGQADRGGRHGIPGCERALLISISDIRSAV